MMRKAARILAILMFFFVVVVTAIWVFQERLVFLPPPVPVAQGRGAERVEYAAADGQQLFGFVCSRPSGDTTKGRPVIMLLHGNGDLADSWMDWCAQVAKETGLVVIAPEYRGYGGLSGKPSAKSVLEDARAAVSYVRRRFGTSPRDIIYYAHSLGSGIATRLAADSGARAVMLEAPITSVVDVGRNNFGAPVSWVLPLISRVDLAPLRDVRRITAPVFVAYGDQDNVVPVSMPPAVFAAALNKGELLRVAGAGHADVAQRGAEAYRGWFRRALERAKALPLCDKGERDTLPLTDKGKPCPTPT